MNFKSILTKLLILSFAITTIFTTSIVSFSISDSDKSEKPTSENEF